MIINQVWKMSRKLYWQYKASNRK